MTNPQKQNTTNSVYCSMKTLFGFLLTLVVLSSCNNAEGSKGEKVADLPKASKGEQTATFAGGCFWGLQEGFIQLKGVKKSTSGYSGGFKKNPTYEEVSAEKTGHAEAVQVIYDPSVISFDQLLAVFFTMHDPTQLNRQGPDYGESYRSIAFYRTEDEKKKIEQAIQKYKNAGFASQPVVTQVKKFEVFYPAEAYHQNYYKLNPNSSYIQNVCGPKVQKLRKAFPELLKKEYK